MSEQKEAQASAKQNVINEQTAEQDFERFADTWEIDNNTQAMDDDEKAGFAVQKGRILKAIMSGHATVDDDGEIITYRLKRGKNFDNLSELNFEMPAGDAYTAMDKHKEAHYTAKVNSYLSRMTGQPPATFVKMHALDRKFCEAVAVLFLGS